MTMKISIEAGDSDHSATIEVHNANEISTHQLGPKEKLDFYLYKDQYLIIREN